MRRAPLSGADLDRVCERHRDVEPPSEDACAAHELVDHDRARASVLDYEVERGHAGAEVELDVLQAKSALLDGSPRGGPGTAPRPPVHSEVEDAPAAVVPLEVDRAGEVLGKRAPAVHGMVDAPRHRRFDLGARPLGRELRHFDAAEVELAGPLVASTPSLEVGAHRL